MHQWLLGFLLLPLLATAQLKEFQVTKMEQPDVSVVQANTQFPDDALVLVYSSIDGLRFRSSMGGVDKQSYNEAAGRYEILLKPVKQMVFVVGGSFIESKVSTLNPRPKQVFYFLVEEQNIERIPNTEGRLEVITNPPGAVVFINGIKAAQKTPFQSKLLSQSYQINLGLVDHVPIDTTVQVKPSEVTRLEVNLVRPSGKCFVDVDPSGSQVYANGILIGVTPLVTQLKMGSYSIEVLNDGYFSLKDRVDIIPDRVARVSGELIKNSSEICVDPKGREYDVIKIGGQLWMAENLAYKTAMEGCWPYKDDGHYVEKYGYLYTWEVAQESCPEGWRLPSVRDWRILLDYLGGEGLKAGAALMKKKGFNAVPSGFRSSDAKFKKLKRTGVWWSDYSPEKSVGLGLILEYPGEAELSKFETDNGFSVRCVKD